MKKSEYVCARCGLPVRSWREGWKHSAGQHSKSCGKPPAPVKRSDSEANEGAALARAMPEAFAK
jgi:DNA-directed RNA polymerase subunit RPC12/RpoP